MTTDDINDYIACVNGGSGVIFQPSQQDYTYILTAKHVASDIDDPAYNGNFIIHYHDSDAGVIVSIPPFPCNAQNYFPHPDDNIDISIIRIPRIETPNKQIFLLTLGDDRNDYWLTGFPEQRRENPITINCIRQDPGLMIKGQRLHKRRE